MPCPIAWLKFFSPVRQKYWYQISLLTVKKKTQHKRGPLAGLVGAHKDLFVRSIKRRLNFIAGDCAAVMTSL